MAVPRNRLSNARKNSKRAHHAKKPKAAAACPRCGTLRIPHVICQSCGTYGNRVIFASEQQAE